jgi:trehalose-phosphatase
MDRIRTLANGPRPLLLATDLDGTLAPIVQRASQARVPEATLAVLDRLTAVAKVAVITGRDLNMARRMVPCEGVIIVGSHGLEVSLDGTVLSDVNRATLAASLEQAEQQVIGAVPSAFLHIERKAISTAFHYRRAPELESQLRNALATLPAGLRLREGRMVLEVLPDAEGGKDIALTALARHLRVKSLMVMGDDATDVAMFRAGLALRGNGMQVLVAGISGGPETPPEIPKLADILLMPTEDALEAMEILARSLGA